MNGFTLEESARRLGHLRWVEMRLFEILGRWVTDTADHAAKLAYVAGSRHHGWHSQLLEERLPTVRELSPTRQTVPPSAGFEALVRDVAAIDDPLDRSVALSRVVLPHLLSAYESHLTRCTPVADAVVMRSVGFILLDLRTDLAISEERTTVLAGRGGEDPAERATEVQRRLAEQLEASGGIPTV